MQKYTTYGLKVDSVLRLPELIERRDSSPPDVVVRYGELKTPPAEELKNHGFVQSTADGVYVYWDHVGGLLVREGREVIVDPLPDAEDSVIRVGIIGVALGILLHQRGFLTLHASAVALNGEVVAFIGNKGWGKSTMAAALHRRGHRLVTDDILAIPPASSSGQPQVTPGFPLLKLWPDAATASLGDDPEQLPKIHPLASKRARSVKEGFQQTPLPLRCIYVLHYMPEESDGSCFVKTEALSMQKAFKELVSHSYTKVGFVDDPEQSSGHLHACTQLINNAPVRRLVRQPSLDRLTEVAKCVEEDVAELKRSDRKHGSAPKKPRPPQQADVPHGNSTHAPLV